MTETVWRTCEDPRKLLVWLRGLASDRKLRLFACAFWRRWWHAQICPQPDGEPDRDLIRLLDYAEQWAERGSQPEGDFPGGGFGWHPLVARSASDAANWTVRETSGCKGRTDSRRSDPKNETWAAEQQVQLLREVFGNPFRTVTLDPAWLMWGEGIVRKLAASSYEEQAFDHIPVLADALEEAGCTDQAILDHCRWEGQHVRGCWVLDLLLGNK